MPTELALLNCMISCKQWLSLQKEDKLSKQIVVTYLRENSSRKANYKLVNNLIQFNAISNNMETQKLPPTNFMHPFIEVKHNDT